MSRPANPSYVVPVWAPDAGYPASADPWTLTPTKQPHPGAASVGYTPKTGVPAQCINQNLNDAYTTDQAAKDYFGAVLDWTSQSPALTFLIDKMSSFSDLGQVRYSPALRTWMFCGGFDAFGRSADLMTPPPGTEIPVPLRTTQECYDFDVDTAGNVVMLQDNTDAVYQCTAAGTWACYFSILDTLTRPNVLFEPISNKWFAAALTGPSVRKAWKSSDRVTWTLVTTPSVSASSTMTTGTNGAGRIVVQGFNGTNAQFCYTDDLGTTWSAPQTIALGFTQLTAARSPKPVWNGSYWLACAFSSTASKIFKSVDGVTWTTVASFTSAAVCYLACSGELWLGITQAKDYVISIDGGVTWRFGDRRLPGLPKTVFSTGQRFLIVGQAGLFHPGGTSMGAGITLVT